MEERVGERRCGTKTPLLKLTSRADIACVFAPIMCISEIRHCALLSPALSSRGGRRGSPPARLRGTVKMHPLDSRGPFGLPISLGTMLIFVELSKADANKELAVRKAFKQQYGTDPIIGSGEVSRVKMVSGTAKPQENSGNAEREWVRSAVETTIEGAQRTLEYCLSRAA